MNKVFFINSAKFNIAEIDLRKRNIFFVGDNGSGKTTAIRAIQYYYNSDVKALGIDANKRSFKDFYFPFENSYIIYEFDDYFVLMYKVRGDIKRVFVRGKFDLSLVLEENNVLTYKDVIKKIRATTKPLVVNTNEEFKKIIYGLDFKNKKFQLADIKNYETFIRLFNKIFNVNKAVFDATSIKETIATTLQRDIAGKIDYEEFFLKIKEFKRYFNFYSRFKRNLGLIDEIKRLKEETLKINKEIDALQAKISYKKEKEESLLKDLEKELKFTSFKLKKNYSLYSHLEQKSKNCEKEIEKKILNLEISLEEIEKLKSIYTKEKLISAEDKALEYEKIQEALSEVNNLIMALQAEMMDSVAVLEDEIKELKRKKRLLDNDLKEKELIAFRRIDEELEEEIKKEKEKVRVIERELEEKENLLNENIRKLKEDISKLYEEKESILSELKEAISKLKEKFAEKRAFYVKSKRELLNKIEDNKSEIEFNKRKLKELKRKKEEKEEELKEEFFKEEKNILNRISFFESILETKEGSFKEFLIQNVENWEVELYPILDDNLLNKSVEELKPKIISDTILGIKLDTTKLKTIPTMTKAEEEIEDLKNYLKELKKTLEEKIVASEKEFKSKEIKLSSLIDVLSEENVKIEEKIKEINEEIKSLDLKLNEKINNLKREFDEKLKLVDINIDKKKKEISSLEKEKKQIMNSIKEAQKNLQKKVSQIKKEFEIKKKEIKKSLKEEIEKEKKEIDELIKNKESQKASITKDEKLKELRNKKIELEKKLKESLDAQQFLRNYEDVKEKINSYEKIKEEIDFILKRKNRFLNFSKVILNKIKEKETLLKNKKDDLERDILKVNRGLEKVKNFKTISQKIQTDEFLDNLIDSLKEKKKELSYLKSELIDKLRSVRNDLEKFVMEGLDVSFIWNLVDKLEDNELRKIDELIEFKEKRFETHTRVMIEEVRNLIEGILEREIKNFEDAKDDFISQIKRVNSNLSKVDFGVVKDVKLIIEDGKKDILKLFDEIKKNIDNLIILLENEKSLFFDKKEAFKTISKIESLFEEIKNELNKEEFSLSDIIDIKLEFKENEEKKVLRVIKNESSTGGSILLKIAIAVSLLELFLREKANFFLILDEVSVLSTKNQKLLKEFVNEKGLGVIYVTPDLPLVDVEEIDIYKFRSENGEFEVIRLINEDGINVEEII